MNLSFTTEQCIFLENCLDDYIETINESIEETKEEMNEQDEDSEQYIRNLQFTFEFEEKINDAKKIRNKIHNHCTKVFATPEWQAQLK